MDSLNLFKAIAITLVIVGITLAMGIYMMGKFKQKLRTETSVTGEEHAITTVPTVIQVNHYPVKEDSETLTWKNTTSGETQTLTKGTNYEVVSYDEGKFNITSVPATGSDTVILFDYIYYAENEATQGIADIITELKGLTTWISIIVISIVAVVIFGLFRGFARSV